MKKFSLQVIVLILGFGVVHSGCGQSPELVFVDALIQEQEKSAFNFWDASHQQLPGGSMVRGLLDVTGDGQEDLLFCSTIDSEFQWSLFVAENGSYSHRGHEMKIQGPAARLRRAGGLTFLTDLSIHSDWLGIIENQIDSRGRVRVRQETVESYSKVQELREQAGWPNSVFGEGVRFSNAEVVTLQEFLQNPDVRWRSYSFDYPLHSQEEAMPESLRLNLMQTGLTPKEAKKALEKIRKTGAVPTASQSKSERLTEALSPGFVEKEESVAGAERSSPHAGPVITKGHADLIWATGGVVAIAAILLGLLKRRR